MIGRVERDSVLVGEDENLHSAQRLPRLPRTRLQGENRLILYDIIAGLCLCSIQRGEIPEASETKFHVSHVGYIRVRFFR